jgi:benzoyl-CoA reductase subunit C
MTAAFGELVDNRHEYARNWKTRTGGKVLGYFCTYVPEELVYAAGVLPVRILGSHEPDSVTERHIYTMYCPFCRDCLAQGLRGRYDYLDGIAIAHSCVHIRQAFGSWRLHVPVSYDYYLFMPAKPQSPSAHTLLAQELGAFQESLEGWTGRPISQASLEEAIAVCNTNRRLLRQVYELRRASDPPVTGAEAMQMVVSSQMADKREHNALLQAALGELKGGRQDGRETGVRLMIVGSEDDDTEMLKLIESLGATVVIDDHCTGSRYFWNQVTPADDLLSALATRYVERPPCPQKDWEGRRRLEHLRQLARDYNVQGAIVIQQKFCDPHELDNPAIITMLREELGLPSLFLEFDVTIPVGQFRTRIEAFLEMLRLEL